VPLDNPWFYVVAVPALLIAGISKGGFGGGLGIITVPLMAMTISPLEAAAIVAPLLCTMDIFGLRSYWGTWDRRFTFLMVPGAFAGIALAALTFGSIDEAGLRIFIGGVALVFSLYYWLQLAFRLSHRGLPAWLGPVAGALSGFTSFIAHAGGPPVQVFLLAQNLDKTLYVGTTVVFFTVLNYIKLVPYTGLGLFTWPVLTTALVLSPLAPAGMWLGVRLHGRVSQALFYKLCYGFLVIVGAKLVADGLGF
jgi:hypothetical protein